MSSLSALRIASAAATLRALPRSSSTLVFLQQQTRGMATEKQILNQINATKNIQKITSSMKMVSAAKLKGDENRLTLAKPFYAWTTKLGSTMSPTDMEDATFDELPNKSLLVPFTSEKGLCGGINSFISRGVRDCVTKLQAAGKTADIAVIGDKGRAQLQRRLGDSIVVTATEVQAPGTFALASQLASDLLNAADDDYDAIVLMYNSYVNAAVYKQQYKVITPFVFSETQESLSGFDFDSDGKQEALGDLYEYMIACQIFHSFLDGAAAEQSSRMTAMENASKNASEMIDSLTLRYNRARQARITTELIEIISGAAALED